jgi:hypothetical protein
MRAGLWGRLRKREADRPPPQRTQPEPERVFTPELTEAILKMYPAESQDGMRRILEKGDVKLLVFFLWYFDKYRTERPSAQECDDYFLRIGWMSQEEHEAATRERLERELADLRAKLGVTP